MEYDGYVYWNNNFDNATTFTGGEYYRQICKGSYFRNICLYVALLGLSMCIALNCIFTNKLFHFYLATCNDGLQNAKETGVDCGGPNCPACGKLLLYSGNHIKFSY